MNNYQELQVWQEGVDLAVKTYRLTATLPKDERFGMVSQMRRAACSIPANIAEGWARGSTKEYIQFLLIARGSLMELETHLVVATRLSFVKPALADEFNFGLHRVARMLNALIRSLRNKGSA